MKREINMIKEKFTKIIEKELPRLFDITKSLYENPEIGTLEYKSSKPDLPRFLSPFSLHLS